MKSFSLAAALLAISASFSCQAVEVSAGVMKTQLEFDSTELDQGTKGYFTLIWNRGIGLEVAHGKYGSNADADFTSTNLALIAATTGDVVRFYGKLGAAIWEFEGGYSGRYYDGYYYRSYVRDGEDVLLGFGMNIDIGNVQLKMEVESLDNRYRPTSINAGIGLTF